MNSHTSDPVISDPGISENVLPVFNMYDNLLQKIGEVTEDIEVWKKTCTTINNLPITHTEIIYALILHYYLIEMSKSGGSKEQLDTVMAKLQEIGDSKKGAVQQPYGMRTFGLGKGVMFTVDNLPKTLQMIIIAYVRDILTENEMK